MDAFGDSLPAIIPLDGHEELVRTFNRISDRYDRCFLFESLVGPHDMAETSVLGFDPCMVLRGYADRITITNSNGTETIRTDDPFSEIKGLLGRNNSGHRYLGGAVGSVNYDAVRLTEDIADSHGHGGPLMEFGIYADGIVRDSAGNSFYFYYGENRLDQLMDGKNAEYGEFSSTPPAPRTSAEQYCRMVERAKRYIHDGDIFQAVLSRRFDFEVSGDDRVLYERLRRMNPSPYMYHLRQGARRTIGSSPEMLVRVARNTVETFPIAGTRRTTGDAGQDAELAEEMLHDEKELAEHTMLVDLGRNDIGRVCRYGSVSMVEFMKVQRFSHVQHLVSHVRGKLDKNSDMFDAFRSVFPAGTVSGAPKVRAMEIIDELEPDSRGPYAGAVGYFSFSGCCDFAIAIRSIFLDGNRGFVQAGAGIVSDSDPASEFQETEHKARAMLQAVGG